MNEYTMMGHFGHLYKVYWANDPWREEAKEYQYRAIMLKDGRKVHDKIYSIWATDSRIVQPLIKSFNKFYPPNDCIPESIEYIHYLV